MALVRLQQDGPRDYITHITGTLAAASESTTVTLASMSKGGPGIQPASPNDIALSQIWYSADAISVQILWEATVDELAWILGPAGSPTYYDFRSFGDIRNLAGAGKTGNFKVSALSGTGSYSIVLWMKKKYP